MKKSIFLCMVAFALLASCSTHYVAIDSVGRGLSGSRTFMAADSLSFGGSAVSAWQRTRVAKPQAFDFRSGKDTMRYAYTAPVMANGWTLEDDSLPRMLRPQVSVSKRFRWFSTQYEYRAVFPQLDSLPVPVTDYMSAEEARLLFRPSSWPDDWNGAEIYALLDTLNAKYVRWLAHCIFECEYNMLYAQSDSLQRQRLSRYHDTLLACALAEIDSDNGALEQLATRFPELAFVNQAGQQQNLYLSALLWFNERYDASIRVLWRVELPGGKQVEHMVNADRLVVDDYVIECNSRVVNWWAWGLTLLVLLAAAWLILRGVPCGAGRSRSLRD